jgi:ribonuclease BN (tRNA processing enzyme)
MKVRVLGCSGAISKGCRTTSFLVDDDTLVDAGTGLGDLTLDEMQRIDHVFLTHSHLDHIAALPLMVDSIGGLRSRPIEIHALAGTIDALRCHVFNGVIWPDFSSIPSPDAPFVRFQEIEVGQPVVVAGKRFEPLPAVHTVPAVGYAVSAGGRQWVFSGDTGRNPAFWSRVNALDVGMLVIETAFSNRESDLARRSMHLSPQSLEQELGQMDPSADYPIFVMHTKPAETELIMTEIQQFSAEASSGPAGKRRALQWMQAGQVFDID